MATSLQKIVTPKAFRGSATENVPDLPIEVNIDGNTLLNQSRIDTWIVSGDLAYLRTISFTIDRHTQQNPRVVKFPSQIHPEFLFGTRNHKEDEMKEDTAPHDGYSLRSLMLRAIPFGIFLIITFAAVGRDNWKTGEMIGLLIAAIISAIITIVVWLPRS